MLTHPKILVWGDLNFEKLPKTGFWNFADMYSKACKNETTVVLTGSRDENTCATSEILNLER